MVAASATEATPQRMMSSVKKRESGWGTTWTQGDPRKIGGIQFSLQPEGKLVNGNDKEIKETGGSVDECLYKGRKWW
jgi:hypothetical protein